MLYFLCCLIRADNARWCGSMAEQLICNQQVGGSSPSTSSNLSAAQQSEYGGIPEWPKGADCKSVVSDFDGPNPSSPTMLCNINRCTLKNRGFPRFFSFILAYSHLPPKILFCDFHRCKRMFSGVEMDSDDQIAYSGQIFSL